MPEKCPICDEIDCTHCDDAKTMARLDRQVKMLEGAIEGWRSVHGEALAEVERLRGALSDTVEMLDRMKVSGPITERARQALVSTNLSQVSSSSTCHDSQSKEEEK